MYQCEYVITVICISYIRIFAGCKPGTFHMRRKCIRTEMVEHIYVFIFSLTLPKQPHVDATRARYRRGDSAYKIKILNVFFFQSTNKSGKKTD